MVINGFCWKRSYAEILESNSDADIESFVFLKRTVLPEKFALIKSPGGANDFTQN